ncbi:hypothetical protein AWN76_003710 [Rhodothermaceae bacterium RA]|nr:hypothetical protein AWN76_003710 [Rhodothermaceae bacterium RA]
MPFPYLRLLFVLIALLPVLAGCSRSYDVRGRVAGFGDDGRTVIVEHEAIPGLMPAMTMPFNADASVDVQALQPGQAIRFTFVVTRDSSWIRDVEVLPDDALPRHPAGADTRPRPAPDERPILQPGDPVPPVALIDQDGAPLALSDFEGQPLLLTFIYTRCPIPDFCPRMSRHFATLQDSLTARYGEVVRQLSISFDPAHDTPAVLRDYAARYTTNTRQWVFATGTPEQIARVTHLFGVYATTGDGQTIDHNLATALIGPDGRVVEIWRGNRWTPDEVLAAVHRLMEPG